MNEILLIWNWNLSSYSAIHKAAGRTVPGFAWYNSWKCYEAVNGEWSLRVIPTTGRTVDGGFVNSAVSTNRWWTLAAKNHQIHLNFCTQRRWGSWNIALAPEPPSHLVRLSLSNIYHNYLPQRRRSITSLQIVVMLHNFTPNVIAFT